MSKKIIPQQEIHYCDKCGGEVKKSDIDSTGYADFVGRDYQGHAVGGYRVEFELCVGCTYQLDKFLKGEK